MQRKLFRLDGKGVRLQPGAPQCEEDVANGCRRASIETRAFVIHDRRRDRVTRRGWAEWLAPSFPERQANGAIGGSFGSRRACADMTCLFAYSAFRRRAARPRPARPRPKSAIVAGSGSSS